MRSVAFSFKACAIKRAAGVMSVLALGGLAGCSSQSARFDGYGFDGGYTNASTGSLPRNASYSDYDNGAASAGYSRSYAPSDVTRETLPPLGGAYDADDNGAPGAPAPGGYKSPVGFRTADGYSPLNRGYGGKGYGGRGGYDARPTEEPPYEAPPYREEPRDGAYIQGEPGPRGGGKEIVVAPGDTLYGLALQYGVSVRELEQSNDLVGRTLRAGETIIIPSGSDGGSYDRRSSYQGGGYRNGGGRDNGGYDGASYDAGAAYSASRAPVRSMSPRGEQYTVKPGDSFFTIGARYGMGPAPLAHHNKLATNATLRPGQVLLIPDEGGRRASNGRPYSSRNGAQRERYSSNESGRPARYANAAPPQGSPRETFGASPRDTNTTGQNRNDAGGAWVERPSGERKRLSDRAPQGGVSPAQPVKVAAREPEKLDVPAPEKDPSDCEDLLANPQPRSSDTFRQPVEGLVISKFGKKDDGTINDGVNYAVPKGTPVKAAENGVVAYVGTEISGFGNLILIRHAGDYVSAYAHNDEVLVKRCEIVKRGQVVAKAGATGTVSKPQLHFELRKASKPVNPEEFFTASKE